MAWPGSRPISPGRAGTFAPCQDSCGAAADSNSRHEQVEPRNTGKELVTVYGKVPRDLAERLDRLADERRWSRAEMVAYCIEQFVEQSGGVQKQTQ